MLRSLFLGATFVVVMTAPALAYIDPVTTSIVLQAVLGGFAAFLVAVRRVREKVFGIFRRKPAEPAAETKDSNNG